MHITDIMLSKLKIIVLYAVIPKKFYISIVLNNPCTLVLLFYTDYFLSDIIFELLILAVM